MRNLILTFLISVALAGCGPKEAASLHNQSLGSLVAEQDNLISHLRLQPYDRENDSFLRSESFDTYFEPVGVLEFSDSILVGNFSSLSVNSQGNMVVADRNAKEVFWFDAKGKLVSELDPEICHPGYSWSPMRAAFSDDGSVMVTNNGPFAGFQFGIEGDCIGRMDLKSWGPKGVALSEGRVYVYDSKPETWSIYHVDSDGTQDTVISSDDFALYNSRIGGGTSDLIAIDGHQLILSQRQSAFTTLVDINEASVTQIGGTPDYFRPIEDSIVEGTVTTEDIFREIRRISEGKSRSMGIHLLSSKMVLQQHHLGYERFANSKEDIAFQIVQVDGTVLNKEPIFFYGYMSGTWAAKDGLLFNVSSLYDMGSGSMEKNNPVVVYRFRPQTP